MTAFLHSPTGNLHLISSSEEWKIADVLNFLSNTNRVAVYPDDVYVLLNGRLVQSHDESAIHISDNDVLRVHYRVPGGKGGFGSMLRAIGAQIEKTTSREACRDLSGRRMRDVNDEKKITEWVAKQADRERELAKEKQERLERRRATPKHNFDDQTYTKEIQKNLERIDDALKQGLSASASTSAASTSTASTSGLKRKGHLKDDIPKKRKMWMDINPDDLDDSDEERDNERTPINDLSSASTSTSTKPSTSTSTKPSTSTSTKRSTSTSTSTKPSTSTITKTKSGLHQPISEPSSSSQDDTYNEVTMTSNKTEEMAETEKAPPQLSTKTDEKNEDATNTSCGEKKPFCIDDYNSAEELEALGLDQLKEQLMALGLKCGGTLQERAQRLLATKGKALEDLDPSFFAKKGKKQKKK